MAFVQLIYRESLRAIEEGAFRGSCCQAGPTLQQVDNMPRRPSSVVPASKALTPPREHAIVDRRYAMANKLNESVCCTTLDATGAPELRALEGPEADDELAKLAKAIGHPARVRIIRMLSRKEAKVCSQIVDELPLAQSTVSEHLRILKEAGLVRSSQDGPRVGYCINFDTLRKLKALIAIV
jgi:ArsR family transcriptional regulator, arsenate/arsenite/antimonite-responsive transcriptional repressor